jgi:hypothetical protein
MTAILARADGGGMLAHDLGAAPTMPTAVAAEGSASQ